MGCLAFSFVSFPAKFGFYASKQVSNQRNNELELEREAEIRMPQNEKLVEFTRFWENSLFGNFRFISLY